MFARIVIDLALEQPLDYASSSGVPMPRDGSLCVVPLGRRHCIGICVGVDSSTAIDAARIRPISRVLHEIEPLGTGWLELTRFAADYYQHAWGEVAVPALPPLFRAVPGPRFAATLARLRSADLASARPSPALPPIELNLEQRAAVEEIVEHRGFAPFVLHGVTGSGKTAVYLEAIARELESEPDSQCLLLVPEIGLTPQLLARLAARFPDRPIVSMHSALGDRERTAAWLATHEGRARIVVGTRLAVFASLPKLRLIVADEEHDTSYKAGDGVRFSARDLAVKRAQMEKIAVVLGSATPSMETWAHAQAGRYRLLRLSRRVEERAVPVIELIDISRAPLVNGMSKDLEQSLRDTVARTEQALIFINRRGYAPVLACDACGWLSKCPRCSVFAAFHKSDRTLRCHHCGWQTRVPLACPTCGNQALDAVGHGTQRVEEGLRRLLTEARIARIDRDTTRQRGAAAAAFEAVHSGATDVLVGTQMISKGHDFQRIALVGILNADAQLVSHDFRAPERLFATLLQVAGRAGRAGLPSRVLVQTRFPRHPLLAAFVRLDYEGFARQQLAERRAAGMPPYVSQALLSAQARELEAALGFLAEARAARSDHDTGVRLYDPVPMPIAQIGGLYRAQLLIESARRRELHSFLRTWLAGLRGRAKQRKPRVRWRIEVDPQEI